MLLLAKIFAVLAIVLFAATFPIRDSFAGKAKLIQRVEKPAGDNLFGDSGNAIGSPQMLIIDDPKAFFGEPKPGEPLTVDEGYLKEHNIYPLQLKTVNFFVDYSRIGCVFTLILSGIIATLVSRRIASKSAEQTPAVTA